MTEIRKSPFSRRRFMHLVGGGAALGAVGGLPVSAFGSMSSARRQDDEKRMLKTLKIGMVGAGANLAEKFQIARDAGFDGIEMDSPGLKVEDVREATKKSGLPVDGTVCSTHWSVRHSSPDAEVRAKALQDLKTAIRDTDQIGGNTVLLVVGHGDDGPEADIWPRSIENIAKALPLAARYGIYIAIENVWNKFLYDHDGDENQTAEKFARYVDDFNSPWVGMQFDIGNHWKYGDVGSWIRTLGKRIMKLDVKGFMRATGKWTPIGEDDIPWADVRAALGEIGYLGWVAAEVGGGDAEYLKTVSKQMDKVFEL